MCCAFVWICACVEREREREKQSQNKIHFPWCTARERRAVIAGWNRFVQQHLQSRGAERMTEIRCSSAKWAGISSLTVRVSPPWCPERIFDGSSSRLSPTSAETWLHSINEICGEPLPPGGNAEKHKMKKQFNRMRQLANQTVGR